MRHGEVLIAEERIRQITEEGFDSKRDDEYVNGELSGAAAAYAIHAHHQISYWVFNLENPPGQTWNWPSETWKPSSDPIRNLVKAGALIAAEIDRLQRITS